MTKNRILKTCKKGHEFYKSSDCPVCPVCDKSNKPVCGFLSKLPAPARRALENNGITSLDKLSRFTETEILEFHGVGPGSIPKLEEALEAEGKCFKSQA